MIEEKDIIDFGKKIDKQLKFQMIPEGDYLIDKGVSTRQFNKVVQVFREWLKLEVKKLEQKAVEKQ